MTKVLRSYSEFAGVYIDDILIFSNDIAEHCNHIRQVMLALRMAGVKVKPTRCQWAMSSLEYMGHTSVCMCDIEWCTRTFCVSVCTF